MFMKAVEKKFEIFQFLYGKRFHFFIIYAIIDISYILRSG